MRNLLSTKKRKIAAFYIVGLLVCSFDIGYRTIDWSGKKAELVPVTKNLDWIKVSKNDFKTIRLGLMQKNYENYKANIFYLKQLKEDEINSLELKTTLTAGTYTKFMGYKKANAEIQSLEKKIVQQEARAEEIQNEIDLYLTTHLLKGEITNENS